MSLREGAFKFFSIKTYTDFTFIFTFIIKNMNVKKTSINKKGARKIPGAFFILITDNYCSTLRA